MELIDKQNKDGEAVEYLNESQLDEIVSQYVTAPVDEADRKLKMMVLSLVSDLRNTRGDLHSAQEEIAKLKEERDALRSVMFSASIETGAMEARAIQAEQERWEYEKGLADMHGQLSEAVRTLEWYGSEIVWMQGRHEKGVFISQAEDDAGARARSIISKIEASHETP